MMGEPLRILQLYPKDDYFTGAAIQLRELAQFLKKRGIQTGIHYPVPCHRQPAVDHLGAPPLPKTERIIQEILTLPLSAGHTEAEIDQVATTVREFFETE